jgi:Legionella pneumophila major outer membrane protein precursor
VAAALFLSLVGERCLAQSPPTANPTLPHSPAPLDILAGVPPSGPNDRLPDAPSIPVPHGVCHAPLPDPGLCLETDAFASVEIAVVFPHLSSLLSAPVPLGPNGPTTTVALRNAHLDATVSPLIQLGAFRFGPGYGELACSYRFLTTDGRELFPGSAGSGPVGVHSRLSLQTFDLDYARNECCLGPDMLLRWEVGARLNVVFFDTQARGAASFEQGRNYFFGAGPHAGVSVTQALRQGLGLFTRCDAALVLGYNTAQNFVVAARDPDSHILSGSAMQQQTDLSPSVAVQAGLSWSPCWLPGSCLRGGYQFEQWYNLGRVAASHGNLNAHSLFLNWEYSF